MPKLQFLFLVAVLLVLSNRASAQIEPGAPGSIEYMVLTNNQTWVLTSDPIVVGGYVQDMLNGRLNQPDGRGAIGIVTEIGFDPPYNQNAAVVDFGRNYSAGIVFSELSSIQLVPTPEPSVALLLLPAGLFCLSVLNKGRRLKAGVRQF